MHIPDHLAATAEKDHLVLGIANGAHGMAELCKAFGDQENALRYYALHVQRVAAADARFCAGCGMPAETRYQTKWDAVVDHHLTKNVAMTVAWTLLALVPFFKWFVKHESWLEQARKVSFTCEQPVCVTCADAINRRALPAFGLRALFWLLKAAAGVVLVCAVAMVFMLWNSRSAGEKAEFKTAWLCLGASIGVLALSQFLAAALCARAEFPGFARKIARRPFVLQSGEVKAAVSPKAAPLTAPAGDSHADSASARQGGALLAGLVVVGLLAGIVGGGVWIYRRSVASMEANAQRQADEENAFRRRVRESRQANQAAEPAAAEPAPAPKP